MTNDELRLLQRRAATVAARVRDSDTQDRIDELYKQVHTGIDVTNPESFGPFLARRLGELHARTDPEDRNQRLCGSGSHLCNVLQGEIPAALVSANRFGDRQPITPRDARIYLQDHSKCHAVRTVLEEWDQQVQAAKGAYRQIIEAGNSASTASDVEIDHGNIPGSAD